MKRTMGVALMSLAVLVWVGSGFAQQQQEQKGATRKEGGDPAAMADFAKALSVQADADQVEEFHALGDATAAELKNAQEIQQAAKSGTKSAPDIPSLQSTIDKTRADLRQFIKDLSKSQKSGLKPQLQKLSKADTELEKASKEFGPNRDQAAAASNRIVQALQHFQTELQGLAEEMGIQPQH